MEKPNLRSRGQSTPIEANVLQNPLLSATYPPISRGILPSHAESSERSTEGSFSEDESDFNSKDLLPVSFVL